MRRVFTMTTASWPVICGSGVAIVALASTNMQRWGWLTTFVGSFARNCGYSYGWNLGIPQNCAGNTNISPHIFVWGSCFFVLYPVRRRPLLLLLAFTRNSFTHTQLCHTQLFHTQHCHTQLFHTQLFHTQLFHTQLRHTHTQLFHTQLCHTHTQLFHTQLRHTHPHTHTTLSHTTSSHTTSSHTHNVVTHAHLDVDIFFEWEAWRLRRWVVVMCLVAVTSALWKLKARVANMEPWSDRWKRT